MGGGGHQWGKKRGKNNGERGNRVKEIKRERGRDCNKHRHAHVVPWGWREAYIHGKVNSRLVLINHVFRLNANRLFRPSLQLKCSQKETILQTGKSIF